MTENKAMSGHHGLRSALWVWSRDYFVRAGCRYNGLVTTSALWVTDLQTGHFWARAASLTYLGVCYKYDYLLSVEQYNIQM